MLIPKRIKEAVKPPSIKQRSSENSLDTPFSVFRRPSLSSAS
ncbi:hypothetical protein NEISICOT_01845 [Neisseria sicca ATCC 29256]|uniref:Uncharacterized protein n=1 Tax=Neisseria sicca ATCC 29256 TaxID=547045 RepID=C6M5P7_NEISI|nr:hypothetical protein NEISICOT_01845 [Neisseria sicca ATCC 29256]